MREYGTSVNRESAAEMLAKRLGTREPNRGEAPLPVGPAPAGDRGTGVGKIAKTVIVGGLLGTIARGLGRAFLRGALGALKGKAPRTTRRTRW
jgi:hypothetical protein